MLGAYNFTRHAITGFFPYMLTVVQKQRYRLQTSTPKLPRSHELPHEFVMLPIPTYPQDLAQPEVSPEPTPEHEAQDAVSDISFQDCLLQIFSDHGTALSINTTVSVGQHTSAISAWDICPFINKSFTYPSNYPIWPHQAEESDVSVARPASFTGWSSPIGS